MSDTRGANCSHVRNDDKPCCYLDIAPIPIRCRLVRCVVNNRPNLTRFAKTHPHSLFPDLPRTGTAAEDDKTMLITASWEGGDVAMEVDEGCRSVDALRHTLAAAVPELDAEKVCLEIGGCAADDEAVCSLCEGNVVTVSVTPAVRAVAILREEGRDVDLGAFCDAVEEGNMRLCELYLDAEVHITGPETPLHIACRDGNLPLCKLLIERGHPLDVLNGVGRAPLHAALRESFIELCTLLIDCRSDLQDGSNQAPLHYAVLTNSVEVCTLLIEKGCCLDVQNDVGDTPLHYAVLTNSVELCTLLIEKGCCLDVQNDVGDTPLYYAIYVASVDVGQVLIDKCC